MALTLKLKDFNGPLDMLLFMIGKAKIDIKDIFVSEVTNQYIRSVRETDDMDMDEASSFIQMAATLLEIKSRSLLPKPAPPEGEEEDPQAVLIRQLEEYARFKQIASDMQGFEKVAALMEYLGEFQYSLDNPESPRVAAGAALPAGAGARRRNRFATNSKPYRPIFAASWMTSHGVVSRSSYSKTPSTSSHFMSLNLFSHV